MVFTYQKIQYIMCAVALAPYIVMKSVGMALTIYDKQMYFLEVNLMVCVKSILRNYLKYW